MSFQLRIRAIAVIAMAVAGGLMAASPGAAAAPRPAVSVAEPVAVAEVPPGIYRIRNLARPDFCLRRASGDTSGGPLVGMVRCTGLVPPSLLDPAESWRFESVAGVDPRWRAVYNLAGGCLDADRRGNRLTKVVHVIPCNVNPGNGSQLWDFPVPGTADIVCSAMRFCEAGDALVLTDDQTTAADFGFRVNLWTPYNCVCQLFYLERVG